MNFGMNTISPITSAATADTSTAPADMSLIFFTRWSYSCVIISIVFSIQVLNISEIHTNAIPIVKAIASAADTFTIKESTTTAILARRCSLALCSVLKNPKIPASANWKLFNLPWRENLVSLFIIFIIYRVRSCEEQVVERKLRTFSAGTLPSPEELPYAFT